MRTFISKAVVFCRRLMVLSAQASALGAAAAATPMLEGQIERPLRYHPDGGDFVITNGAEFFNRPLYGPNTGFRVDAGDKPEFSLYLPGRGGNLRLGLKTPSGAKWLSEADQVVARYRPGSMIYEIGDALAPGGKLQLTALPLAGTEGLVLRVAWQGTAADAELVWAYGGVNGQRGARDGDIGTERVPVGEYFQLQPSFCQSNEFRLEGGRFTLRSRAATMAGVMPPGSKLALAEAAKWASVPELLASASGPVALPVVIGQAALRGGEPLFLVLQQLRPGGAGEGGALAPAYKVEDLPKIFAAAEEHRRQLAERMVVDTPDPFINAAAAALCLAADGVWDERQGVVMHGAVAWRTRLLGWRGDYINDELGWHERARRDFTYWAGRQNTNPIPAVLAPADAAANLSRHEAALHSNGDLSNSHYDMNLVFIDALFRHLLWTGDLDFARRMWPVIQRHLAWEQRLFRRPFGPEGLPLYEGYAAIWASDDLEYEGGGAAHATAYNYYHNKMAARLARLLGEDAGPYEREADLIWRGMRSELWLPDCGWFAEWKDFLGLQLTHPNAALWSIYQTVDSEAATPLEAWQMTRYVDTQIARLPIRGPGVPEGCYTLPTTSWMPYTWSLNNVVMAEAQHTALAFWQAGRGEEAFRLCKGSILDSMFLGLCPGNAGMCTWFDAYRRESQRDFADAHWHDLARAGGGLVRRRAGCAGGRGASPPRLPGGVGARQPAPPRFQPGLSAGGAGRDFHAAKRLRPTDVLAAASGGVARRHRQRNRQRGAGEMAGAGRHGGPAAGGNCESGGPAAGSGHSVERRKTGIVGSPGHRRQKRGNAGAIWRGAVAGGGRPAGRAWPTDDRDERVSRGGGRKGGPPHGLRQGAAGRDGVVAAGAVRNPARV